MPKKVKYESFVYRFLAAAHSAGHGMTSTQQRAWHEFIDRLHFHYDAGCAVIGWSDNAADHLKFPLADAELYRRGDTAKHAELQNALPGNPSGDPVQARNASYFHQALVAIAGRAGMHQVPEPRTASTQRDDRLHAEETFHDQWASSEDPGSIDVRKANEACTSPEMRHIRAELGPLQGKRLLDVGCGLGEASVYFALEGARVTAMDLSSGMLAAARQLATLNGVEIETHKSAAENTDLSAGERFDIIYAGNLLHHVDIAATIRLLKPHLAPGGVFVSWDPVAYNPLINVYRAIATRTRTADEHPLRRKDIRLIEREFPRVKTRFFWLTTLLIFVVMAVVQRRDPNKVRFWKAVVHESERWAWLYRPLSRIDDWLLKCLPPLRWWCWNVVVIARNSG